MDKEVVELALKRCQEHSVVAEILSQDSSPAVGKMRNFLSTVSRISLRVVLGNGRVVRRSVILKDSSTESIRTGEFQKRFSVFKTETMMYETVLKEMEYLMEEFEDTEGVLWCSLIHYVPYTCMVLEDLKDQGFSMMEDRTAYFDLDQSLMAVHCLARFHGMSKILEERGVINKGQFKPWYVYDWRSIHKVWYWNMFAMMEGIKKHWGREWVSIVDKINLTEETISEKLRAIGKIDETKFNTMNHGDCQKNNIMFKYDWKGRPTEMRLLDFQIPHYGSPCNDLIYFMYLGVEPSVRREHSGLLLETYHLSLTKTLDRYSYQGSRPDMEELREGIERMTFVGMFMFLFGTPQLFLDKLDSWIDSKKMAETNGQEGFDIDLYRPEYVKKLLGPDLETFVRTFFC